MCTSLAFGFYLRTEEDFLRIFSDANIPFSAISEMREESGVIVFNFENRLKEDVIVQAEGSKSDARDFSQVKTA